MIQRWKSLLLALGAALMCAGASAAPVHLYEFHTTQSRCIDPTSPTGLCDFGRDFTSELNSMSVGFTEAARNAGSASMSVDYLGAPSPVNLSHDGMASFGLAMLPFAARAIPLTTESAFWPFHSLYQLAATFVITPLYALPSFFVHDAMAEMGMGGGETFISQGIDTDLLFAPSHAGEVAGLIRGDGLAHYYLAFAGEWRYAGMVPEPGSLVLLLLALGVMALVAQRRAITGRSVLYPTDAVRRSKHS